MADLLFVLQIKYVSVHIMTHIVSINTTSINDTIPIVASKTITSS